MRHEGRDLKLRTPRPSPLECAKAKSWDCDGATWISKRADFQWCMPYSGLTKSSSASSQNRNEAGEQSSSLRFAFPRLLNKKAIRMDGTDGQERDGVIPAMSLQPKSARPLMRGIYCETTMRS